MVALFISHAHVKTMGLFTSWNSGQCLSLYVDMSLTLGLSLPGICTLHWDLGTILSLFTNSRSCVQGNVFCF